MHTSSKPQTYVFADKRWDFYKSNKMPWRTLPNMSSHVHSNPIIPLCIAVTTLLQPLACFNHSITGGLKDWYCYSLQQTPTEASGDELTAHRVKLPTLMSWSGIKANWETTTIPARQLRASQHGGSKARLFCMCVFGEWKHHDLHITSNIHATSPCGPESPRTCSTPVR